MQKKYPIEEKLDKTSWKTIKKMICLVVIFLFLFNFLAYYYLKFNTPNLGYKINRKKWKMLEEMQTNKDWLILGDSTCNQGLSIVEFEENIKESAINLCTIGNMLVVNDSWMLEKYIKKFGPPKNILIIHAYDTWYRSEIDLGLTSQLPIISLIKEKPKPWILNKNNIATLFLYKYVPLYSEKSSLLEIIVGIFQKEDPRDQIFFDDTGFMSMQYANPKLVEVSVNRYKNFTKNNRFEISRNNLMGLENIKEISEKYGFNIFIANSPINNDLLKDDGFKLYFADLNNYLENYAKRNERVYYIKDTYAFSKDMMISSDHIIAEAAREYSKKISQNIKTLIMNHNIVK
jgi:hypothetical protein